MTVRTDILDRPMARAGRRVPLLLGAAALIGLAAAGAAWLAWRPAEHRATGATPAAAAALPPGEFVVTDQQRKGLTIEPVRVVRFQPSRTAEGKIAINEDKSTPVFSQFTSARVIRTFANTGDTVEAGAPLARIETPDMVQGGNDLTAAAANLAKARSQVKLLETVEQRQRALFEAKASALKDFQQAQADLAAARNDLRSAEIALSAVRNRLAILGKSAKEIAALESRQAIDATSMIVAPIGGVVVQRKVGPGQYITAASTDPVFLLGDLSTVWLLASVKETDIPFVKVGQPVRVRVLAWPDREFDARITNLGATIDPVTRRLQVRAEVQNPDNMLKPEMFAEFEIATGDATESPAVPGNAIVYEGDRARVWVQTGADRFASRPIAVGIQDHKLVQVLAGLASGEQVVTRGSLFIDRAARPD